MMQNSSFPFKNLTKKTEEQMNYTKIRQQIQAEIEYSEECQKNAEYLDALKELNIEVAL